MWSFSNYRGPICMHPRRPVLETLLSLLPSILPRRVNVSVISNIIWEFLSGDDRSHDGLDVLHNHIAHAPFAEALERKLAAFPEAIIEIMLTVPFSIQGNHDYLDSPRYKNDLIKETENKLQDAISEIRRIDRVVLQVEFKYYINSNEHYFVNSFWLADC